MNKVGISFLLLIFVCLSASVPTNESDGNIAATCISVFICVGEI